MSPKSFWNLLLVAPVFLMAALIAMTKITPADDQEITIASIDTPSITSSASAQNSLAKDSLIKGRETLTHAEMLFVQQGNDSNFTSNFTLGTSLRSGFKPINPVATTIKSPQENTPVLTGKRYKHLQSHNLSGLHKVIWLIESDDNSDIIISASGETFNY